MILDRIIGRRDSLARVGPSYPLTDPALAGYLGGKASAAGCNVSPEQSLTLSAVFAGVSLLSRVLGALPLQVLRRSDRNKTPATAHPAYAILHTQANPEMTACTARRTMEWNRLLYGAAIAEVGWNGAGKPAALWPLEPWRVWPERDKESRELYYKIDGTRRVSPADLIYVPMVTTDGVCGRGFVHYAIDSLGLGMSAQEFAARFFGNDARPGGLLINEGKPTEPQRKEIIDSWNKKHGGASKAHTTGMLWGGWKFDRDAGSVPPDEAQLLETRKFTTEEVARWLGVPVSFLADLSRATFNNVEQMSLNFVVYSLGLTLVEYEQEYDRKLLNPPTLYSKHNVGGLLRGDMAARSAFYHSLIGDGVFSINDARDLEDMNPIEGGDEHFVPRANQPLSQALLPPPPVPTPGAPNNGPANAPKP
jgi:HK97 family phage portal protein